MKRIDSLKSVSLTYFLPVNAFLNGAMKAVICLKSDPRMAERDKLPPQPVGRLEKVKISSDKMKTTK